ncbi:poly(A) polymerase [Streptomyces sp. NPDC050738]|uniref:poly(A) polymerase n=1 Tax=Streptomyces sp. NPDC050738 TaxID=3154744 RepID=UPI003431F6C1
MRTSEQIYHQVRWDPRFDPARFVLGVLQRGAAPKRVQLTSFVPGGDIPWHRVLFVEADGEVVWDRAAGVDRIGDPGTDAGRARAPRLLRAPFFTAVTPYTWDPVVGGWRPARAERQPPTTGAVLSVLTWNTLWDRYDADRIDTARRRPALLDALAAADADVIALQEVEAGLLVLLLAEPWVRAGYTLSTSPSGRQVEENGLLLLSRVPVREAGRHVLGPHKALTALTVESAAGPLVVAVTHLSSDHSDPGGVRRRAELLRIDEGLASVDGEVLLLGDFNDSTGRPAAELGLQDAWTRTHGAADDTPTFDPVANPLAAVSSLGGRPGRLDRVLLRGETLRAAGAELLGTVPAEDGLFVSDHYGVRVELTPGADTPELPGGQAADDLVRRIAGALPDGAVLEVVGSRRMGCALPDADLDLVAVLPGAVDVADVGARLRRTLPGDLRLREVTGARVPGLKLRTAELAADLVVVGAGGLPPAAAVVRRAELGESTAIALSAVSDACAVTEAVGGRQAQFGALARTVKAWARARGLDSAPFGGLPGIAWAVLAARTVTDADSSTPPGELLRDFFARWAVHDWNEPVTLAAPAPAGTPRAPLTVLTPTAPERSCTAQVGAGMRDLVCEELYHAWEITQSALGARTDPRPQLLSPPPMDRRHRARAIVTVRAQNDEAAPSFEATLGRVRGRMRALLDALAEAGSPDAHAWPRPFEADRSVVRYAIGLGAHPPSAPQLKVISDAWRGGLTGTDVIRAGWEAGTLLWRPDFSCTRDS